MAQVFPFRAFRFNPQVAPFDRVLTQPYDKISPQRQAEYYALHPHNLIAVEKGRTFENDSPQNNVYIRAAAKVEQWIRDSVLLQARAPVFTPIRRNLLSPAPEKNVFAAASSAPVSSRITPPAWSSATSTRSLVLKRIAWNFSATHAYTPASSSCSIPTPSGAWMQSLRRQ